MLEQKDLQAIAELMDSRIGKTEEMIKETNQRVSEVESSLTKKIENVEQNVSEVESVLVNELVRTEDILTRKMENIEKNMEEMNRNWQVQNGHITIILEEYHKRLLILEERTA